MIEGGGGWPETATAQRPRVLPPGMKVHGLLRDGGTRPLGRDWMIKFFIFCSAPSGLIAAVFRQLQSRDINKISNNSEAWVDNLQHGPREAAAIRRWMYINLWLFLRLPMWDIYVGIDGCVHGECKHIIYILVQCRNELVWLICNPMMILWKGKGGVWLGRRGWKFDK